jgi:uncharacterized protein YutE (UPF0331/DUF86 family)
MKIDFKKLKTVEKEYRYEYSVCSNTLQTMIDIVLANTGADSAGVNTSHSYLLAVQTLKQLGVITEDTQTPEKQHLNS